MSSALSDAQIAAMTAVERHELIDRLHAEGSELLHKSVIDEIRRVRLWLALTAAIALVPWIVYLAVSLPGSYEAHNWRVAWVGFDVLLLVFFGATAVFGFMHRHVVTVAAFTTGVLLICDAWFDITTAAPADVWVSVVTAALGELPIAAILMVGTLHIVRLTHTRLMHLDPKTPVWRLPLHV